MQLSTSKGIYEVEFTFEAAESDMIQSVFDYFSGAFMFKGITEDGSELEKKIAQTDAMISGISAVPKMSIDLLFMGLLEHHGINGDMTQDVKTRDDAKALYKLFCKENPDSELSIQSGLFEALKVQMEEDGFFKRIGLEQMMITMQESTTEQKQPKVPQDHKKSAKASKTS